MSIIHSSKVLLENTLTGDFYDTKPLGNNGSANHMHATTANPSSARVGATFNSEADFRLFLMLSDMLWGLHVMAPRAMRDLSDLPPEYADSPYLFNWPHETHVLPPHNIYSDTGNAVFKNHAALRVHWQVVGENRAINFVSDFGSLDSRQVLTSANLMDSIPSNMVIKGYGLAIDFAYDAIYSPQDQMTSSSRVVSFTQQFLDNRPAAPVSTALKRPAIDRVRRTLVGEGYDYATFVSCGSVTPSQSNLTSKDRAKTWHVFRARKNRAKHTHFFIGWSPVGDTQRCFVNLTPVSTQTFHDANWIGEVASTGGKRVAIKKKGSTLPTWNNSLAREEEAAMPAPSEA